MTNSEKATVAGCSVSPSTGTANSKARKGCSSCTWLTRTVPPSASARYQAKKPSHIENSETYARPIQAEVRAFCAGQLANVTGKVTGKDNTSTQQMTRSALISPARRAPAT